MILKILLRILYSKLFFLIIFPWVFQHEVGWILVPMSIPLLNSRFCISFQHQSNKYDSVHLWFSFNDGSTTHWDFLWDIFIYLYTISYGPYDMVHIIKYMGHIIYIISKLFLSFVAIIIIIAKNFEILQFWGKIFCNNDDYCNERLKNFWYNGRYFIVSSAIMVGSAAPPNNYCPLADEITWH